MDRRSFFKWFGVGVGAAPAVKAVVTMPDAPTVKGCGDSVPPLGQFCAPMNPLRRVPGGESKKLADIYCPPY